MNNNQNSNNDIIFCNLNINGFSYNTTSTVFQNQHNIKIENEADYYSKQSNKGFYKTGDFGITFNNPKNYLLPSETLYTLQVFQNIPYSQITYNTNKLNFYIEKLDTLASISNITVDTITDFETENISGVPSLIKGNLNFNFISHNITNNFLRPDKKHFNIKLTNNNNISFSTNLNITLDDVKNSNTLYYHNLDNSKHNNEGNILLPNSPNILFKTISININTHTYFTDDLNISVIPYNLIGESVPFYMDSSIKLKIDPESIKVKKNITETNSVRGLYITSGTDEFPKIEDPDFGLEFNHNVDISNTRDLQLINGFFTTPYNINAFHNYSNYFYNNIFSYPNYSNVNISPDKRYITFKYENLLDDINKITIKFIDSNINETTLSTDFDLYIKVNNSIYTYYNTGWLNANKPINHIGINNNSKNIDGTGCLNLYNNYPSNHIKKNCYLPNGSTGDLYIRLGLASNKDLLIKYIQVYTNFI